MGHWSELPGELLDTIEENLVLYGDKIRIRAVCGSWNSHFQKMHNHGVMQFPWLLQAFGNNKNASHGLFNLHEQKFYLLDLPEAREKLFKGSSHGWVSTMQDLDPNNFAIDMHLINPLTRAVITLPPRTAFPDVVDYCADRVDKPYTVLYEHYDNEPKDSIKDGMESYFTSQISLIYLMGKVILSSPPSHSDCVVVAIYGQKNKLAYCKLNDKKWTPICAKFTAKRVGGLLDVIFHKGKLYGINTAKGLVSFDNISPNPKMTEIVVEGPPDPTGYPLYLVECFDGEQLLMVCRDVYVDDGDHPMSIVETVNFRVYKLDLGNSRWIEVKDIGEGMLFVGYNSSISLSSHDFPGYKRNHIYFTDSYFSYGGKEFKQEDSDIGVFNLEDGFFESLPGFKCDPRFLWPPPIWVTPPRL